MGTGESLGKPNKLWGSDLRWTSIPSRGSRNTPSCFMLLKLGKAPATMSYESFNSKASLFSFFFGALVSPIKVSGLPDTDPKASIER